MKRTTRRWLGLLARRAVSLLCTLLFCCTLCHSQLNQETVQVSLITDREKFQFASKVLEQAIIDTSISTFKYQLVSTPSTACDGGTNTDRGAYLLCDAWYRQNISAVLGPTCYDDLELSARLTAVWDILQFNYGVDHPSNYLLNKVVAISTASSLNVAENLRAVMSALGWSKITVYNCVDCFDNSVMGAFGNQFIINRLTNAQITLLIEKKIYRNTTADQIARMLNETRVKGRIILPLLGGTSLEDYKTFMTGYAMADLLASDHAVILYISVYQSGGLSLPWTTNPSDRQLYTNAIIVYNDNYNSTQVKSFASRLGLGTPSNSVLLYYLQLYESFLLYATVAGLSGTATDGSKLIETMQYRTISGPFGSYFLDISTQRISPYNVIMFTQDQEQPMTIINITIVNATCPTTGTNLCSTLTGTVNESVKVPLDMPVCGYEGELCEQTSTILVIIGIIVSILVLVLAFFIFKKLRSNESQDMPWTMNPQDIHFIEMNTQADGGHLSSYQSLQGQVHSGIDPNHSFNNSIQRVPDVRVEGPAEEGEVRGKDPPPLPVLPGRSSSLMGFPRRRRLANVNRSYATIETYLYNDKKTSFTREEIKLFFQMKSAVHDNLNPFMGIVIDGPEMMVGWTHCFRGTLYNVLRESAKRSDEAGIGHNFTGAFMRDLLKGLEFLQSSPLGYHGALTPSNCLVDSHWVLKLSGFGLPRLLHRWRYRRTIATFDRSPLIENPDLHYYAPELRNSWKTSSITERGDLIPITPQEGKQADIYAFGMVLYEVLYGKKYVDLPETAMTEADDDIGQDLTNHLFDFDAETQIPTLIDLTADDDVHPDLKKLLKGCWAMPPSARPDISFARRITDATLKMSGSLVDQMMRNLEHYTGNLENLVQERTVQLAEAQKRSTELLEEMLPRSVANELKAGRRVDAKLFKHVTILYSDIVGFTSLCSESQPMEVVALLSGVFQAFDRIISHHNTYKVETIGDAYMVASGVPEASKDHVRNIASVALMNREFLQNFEIPHRPGQHLHCRWGFNSGAVSAGVVGMSAPRYCIFGQTVSIAAKMESSGVPDKVQMTHASFQLLTSRFPEFKCTPRGQVKLDGIGMLLTYFLDGIEELLMSDRSSYRRAIAADAEVVARAASRASIDASRAASRSTVASTTEQNKGTRAGSPLAEVN